MGPFWTINNIQIFVIWLLWEILTSLTLTGVLVHLMSLTQDQGSSNIQVIFNITRYSANSTDSGNILDLVLTNNEHLITDVSVHPDSFNSDHFPVSFVINAKLSRPKNVNRKVYCYKKADFDGLRSTLKYIP